MEIYHNENDCNLLNVSVKSFVFYVEQFLTNISSLKDTFTSLPANANTKYNIVISIPNVSWLRDAYKEYVHILYSEYMALHIVYHEGYWLMIFKWIHSKVMDQAQNLAFIYTESDFSYKIWWGPTSNCGTSRACNSLQFALEDVRKLGRRSERVKPVGGQQTAAGAGCHQSAGTASPV